jgi:hypothetical protein
MSDHNEVHEMASLIRLKVDAANDAAETLASVCDRRRNNWFRGELSNMFCDARGETDSSGLLA